MLWYDNSSLWPFRPKEAKVYCLYLTSILMFISSFSYSLISHEKCFEPLKLPCLFQWLDIPTYQWLDIPMYQWLDIPTYQWLDIPMYQWLDIPTQAVCTRRRTRSVCIHDSSPDGTFPIKKKKKKNFVIKHSQSSVKPTLTPIPKQVHKIIRFQRCT